MAALAQAIARDATAVPKGLEDDVSSSTITNKLFGAVQDGSDGECEEDFRGKILSPGNKVCDAPAPILPLMSGTASPLPCFPKY